MHSLSLAGVVISGVLAVAAFAFGAEPVGGTAVAKTVTLRVVDESGVKVPGPLHMPNSRNGWNPGDPAWRFEMVAGSTPPAWTYRVDLSKLPDGDGGIEFKFARGAWGMVEVSAEGNDVDNRVLEFKALREAAGTTVELASIKGYADQRGTRWPHMSAPGAEQRSTVTGTVEVHDFNSKVLKNTRKVRVWLPEGYSARGNEGERYPVLYMLDGQNSFDVVGSAIGVEWRCDEAATELIKAGKIDPMIIVAIDNIGDVRAEEYNPPYTSYLNKQNRGDQHLRFITDEVMPFVNETYRTKTGREHTGIGGSSFGGNATLYAVMERPDVFGRAIVESAAVFLDNRAIVRRAEGADRWPIRMFMAVGTAETARSGDAKAFADMNRELMSALRLKGLGEDRLMTVVEEGGKHSEGVWAKRFPAALGFVFGKE